MRKSYETPWQKDRPFATVFIMMIVLMVLMIVIHNRIAYGNWNPLNPPERFQYAERAYYRSSHPTKYLPIHPGTDGPKWYYGFVVDDYTDYAQTVPTVLCLQVRNTNRYLIYALSGGP